MGASGTGYTCFVLSSSLKRRSELRFIQLLSIDLLLILGLGRVAKKRLRRLRVTFSPKSLL